MIYLALTTAYIITGLLFAMHSYRQDKRVVIAIASVPLWWFLLVGIMIAGFIEKQTND